MRPVSSRVPRRYAFPVALCQTHAHRVWTHFTSTVGQHPPVIPGDGAPKRPRRYGRRTSCSGRSRPGPCPSGLTTPSSRSCAGLASSRYGAPAIRATPSTTKPPSARHHIVHISPSTVEKGKNGGCSCACACPPWTQLPTTTDADGGEANVVPVGWRKAVARPGVARCGVHRRSAHAHTPLARARPPRHPQHRPLRDRIGCRPFRIGEGHASDERSARTCSVLLATRTTAFSRRGGGGVGCFPKEGGIPLRAACNA